MSSPILVIGIGNDYRSDDGVGLMVLRTLKARNLPDIVCLESNGDGAALLETWSSAQKVILIDVVSSGAPPGTTYRFDVRTQSLPASCSFQSTHAFGVAEAIQMAQALHQLPAELIVYGIEGKQFCAGTNLSPEVRNAAGEVVAQIVHEVQEASRK